jgi:hypothetical protein
MQTEKSYKNILMHNTFPDILIGIRKRYDGTLLILFAVIAIIVVGLHYALYLGRAQKETFSGNTFLILHILFTGLGGLMLIGPLYLFFRKESMILNKDYLIHRYSFFGFQSHQGFYKRESILDLQKTGIKPRWKKVNTRKSKWHQNSEYSFDFRKILPAIEFRYENKKILLAIGISPEEADHIIAEIRPDMLENK